MFAGHVLRLLFDRQLANQQLDNSLNCMVLTGSYNALKNLMDDTDVVATAQLEVCSIHLNDYHFL